MKKYIKFYGWTLLWVLPLSIAFGWGQFNTDSIIMFTLASLAIPLALKNIPTLAPQFDFDLSKGHYTFGWIWWNLFFFFGNGVLPYTLPKEPIYITLVWIVTMMVVLGLMLLTAIGLGKWMEAKKFHPFIQTVLNISTYALPIPLLFLGDVMYLNLNDPLVVASLTGAAARGLELSLFLGLILLIITTVGSMVFYLYPRRKYVAPRIMAIAVMSVFWVATNAHVLFGGYIPDVVKVWIGIALPAFTGSYLVYITPAIFEIGAIALSVAIGLGLETLWISAKEKKENI